ncbi:MAG: hypothetical protein KAS12_01475 [Candidatus Aenigmarchaeota archaeon]|nr:hypothetical protein [Candidatus Aenigmarchaeota archaeon]
MTSKNRILFLQGINKKRDYVSIEDKFDGKLRAKLFVAPEKNEAISGCFSIPDYFYDLERWPSSSNLKCWYCDQTFNTRPIFIPGGVRECLNVMKIEVIGNFCSFPCVINELSRKNENNNLSWSTNDLLRYLFKIFTGQTAKFFTPGIDKTEMQQYGGKLTPRQFREKNTAIERTYSSQNHTLDSISVIHD